MLSVVLSGSVLIGFGLYFISIMNRVGIDRIDREILALGGSQLHARAPRVHWLDFDKSLRFIYGEDRSKELVVQIRSSGNEVIYQSEHWPTGISEESFPDFDHALETLPAPFRERGRQQGPPAPQFDRPFVPPAASGRAQRDPRNVDRDMREPRRLEAGDEQGRGMSPGFRETDERFREFPPSIPEADQAFKLTPVRIKKPFFQTIKTPKGSWRTGIMGNQYITILLGLNMEGFYQDADRFQKAFWSIAPLALLFLAGGGWVIAHRALKPVALITRTAEGITARSLDQRIPLTSSDRELSRLVQVINSMLDRLQKGFAQAVRFSADAAHELQTPLTVLQGELDDAVQHAMVGSEEQRRYSALLEETQRLKVIVQKLLILARADAGELNLHMEPVDLSSMVDAATEDVGVIAPNLQIEKNIAPGVMVKADPDLLRQVIQNLTSNAVKYNQGEGLIRFQLSIRGNKAHLTISNTGKPIPLNDREMIFDRFYRVDKSRSRTVPGAGLGLSLAREIASAHHGDLRLYDGHDNLVSFVLTLPCSSH